jgi:RNA polymerase sigma-70 factor (ECF subfamily)
LRGIAGSEATTAAARVASATGTAPDPRARLREALERELPRVQRSVAIAVVSSLRKAGRAAPPDVVRAEAEETLQEVARRALQKPEAFDPERSSPHAWFYGIALNVLREHHRAGQRDRARIVRLDQPARPAGGNAAPTLEDLLDDPAAADPQRVMELLSLVDGPERSLLTWRHVEQASITEIAVRLRVREGAARTRLCRARTKLEAAFRRTEAVGAGSPRQPSGAESGAEDD